MTTTETIEENVSTTNPAIVKGRAILDARPWISARGVARLTQVHIDEVPRLATEAHIKSRQLPGGFAVQYCRIDVLRAIERAMRVG